MKTFIVVVGWVAALLLVGAYGLLSAGKLDSRSKIYQTMNITGSVGFIANSGWYGAWPSVALNVVWLGIGLYAMRGRSR